MKLIIEIPEDSYKATCSGLMQPPDVKNVVEAIKNGTPLPEHLNKIKDEIDLKQYSFMANSRYDEGVRFGLMMGYQIIDKHLEESDSE